MEDVIYSFVPAVLFVLPFALLTAASFILWFALLFDLRFYEMFIACQPDVASSFGTQGSPGRVPGFLGDS